MNVKASRSSRTKTIYRLKINGRPQDHVHGSGSGVQNKESGATSELAWVTKGAMRTVSPQVEGGSQTNHGNDPSGSVEVDEAFPLIRLGEGTNGP